MNKAEELKNLLVKTEPNNPAYGRIKIALEAFFGLRQEFIAALSKRYLLENGFDKAVKELVNHRVDNFGKISAEEYEQKEKELSAVVKKLGDEAKKKAIGDADKIIDDMLLNQKGIRKLNDIGQTNYDILENVSQYQVKVEAEHDA
jgi:hypothetical protein